MITNSQGQVAIRYYQPAPKAVRIGKKNYAFACSNGIPYSWSWVDAEDVNKILAQLGGCCGGKRLIFSPVSDEAGKRLGLI